MRIFMHGRAEAKWSNRCTRIDMVWRNMRLQAEARTATLTCSSSALGSYWRGRMRCLAWWVRGKEGFNGLGFRGFMVSGFFLPGESN